MKSILFCILLLVSAPVFASSMQDTLCAEMTVRLTLFTVNAAGDWKEDNFKAFWYKKIINNSDENSKKILMKLVDVAWANREKDVNEVAMRFYKICSSGTET